jgi:hypothetical protein
MSTKKFRNSKGEILKVQEIPRQHYFIWKFKSSKYENMIDVVSICLDLMQHIKFWNHVKFNKKGKQKQLWQKLYIIRNFKNYNLEVTQSFRAIIHFVLLLIHSLIIFENIMNRYQKTITPNKVLVRNLGEPRV